MTRWPLLAGIAVLAVACADDEPIERVQVVDGDPAVHDQALTDDVFDGIEADAVVATAGGEAIVASEVAAWLDVHPGLTVEQAVDDLVDARLAAAAARAQRTQETHRRFDIVERDARIRARFIAWHRMNILAYPDAAPDDELVAAWMAEPLNLTRYGRPALTMASQVLVMVPEDASPEDRAAARDEAEALATALRAESADTVRLTEAGQALYEATPEDAGYTVRNEVGLIFPEVDSGTPTWPGLQQVVPEFAEAVFDARPGAIVGPVETVFGYHVVLVEGRLPAVVPDDDEIRALAVELMSRDRTRQHLIERMTELRPSLQIHISETDINLLALTGVERAAAVAERRAVTLR